MPAFLAACVAAIVIAVGAYFVLEQSGHDSVSSVFTSSSTRLNNS